MSVNEINKKDTLNSGRNKINNAIKAFNETVVSGDSSVEAAQARVGTDGNTYTTLKERIDTEHTEVKSRLAETQEEIASIDRVKVDKTEVENNLILKRDKNTPIGLNDVASDLLSAIQNKEGETTFNLLAEPRPRSVTYDKTTFLNVGKNKFDKSKATNGFRISPSSNGKTEPSEASTVSDYTFVKPNAKYTSNKTINLAFYGVEKNFISYAGITSGTSFTIPVDAYYVRFSTPTTNVESLQLELGDVLTDYEDYKETLTNVKIEEASLPIETHQKINELKSFKDQFTIVSSRNIINPAKYLSGKSLTSAGNLTDNQDATVVDFTEVKPNTTYTANKVITVAEYDVNQNFIKRESYTSETPFTTQSNTVFIRVSVLNTNLDGLQIEEGNQFTFYEKYFEPYYSSGGVESYSPLRNKNGIAFGDSITMQSTFPSFISELDGTYFFNAGFGATRLTTSGSTSPYHLISMSHISDAIASGDWSIMQPSIDAIDIDRGDNYYSTVYNELKQIDFATIDYITIMYGTNDMNYTNLTVGAEDSMDTTTVNGAINHVLTNILSNYPQIKVYWMTPIFKNGMTGGNPPGNSDEVTNGPLYLYEIAEAIVNAAKRWHIPVYDMYNKSGINALTANYYLKDPAHPGDKGNQLMAEKVRGFLTTQ